MVRARESHFGVQPDSTQSMVKAKGPRDTWQRNELGKAVGKGGPERAGNEKRADGTEGKFPK